MATISETGYAKLIANLKVLISAAIRFAEKFNPSSRTEVQRLKLILRRLSR